MNRISWKLLRFRTQQGLHRTDARLRSTTEDGQGPGVTTGGAREIMAKLAQVEHSRACRYLRQKPGKSERGKGRGWYQ